MPRTVAQVRHRTRTAPRVNVIPAPAPEMATLDFVQMDVTPEMAARWLEGKCKNRNINNKQVEKFAKDMIAGAWHLNGETIVFSEDETLMDGQHRLWAVVESGCTVKLCIVKGAKEDSMDTFDMGRARTFSDALQINGKVDTRYLAGAARWWRWYDSFRKGGLATGGHPSHAELKVVLAKHPMVELAAGAIPKSKAKRLIPAAVLTFVLSAAMERDIDAAEQWLNALASGQGLPEDSATYLLRERMIVNASANTKLDQMYVAAYTIKAWNYWFKRRPMRSLRWGATGGNAEAFPNFED